MKKLSIKIFVIMTTVCLLLSGCGQSKTLSFSLKEQYDPATMSFPEIPWESSLPEVYKTLGIKEPRPPMVFTGVTDTIILPITLTDPKASGQMTLGFASRGEGPQLRGIFFDLSFADKAAENAFWEKYEKLAVCWAEKNEAFQEYLNEESKRTSPFSDETGLRTAAKYERWEEKNEDLAFAYGGKWRIQLRFSGQRYFDGDAVNYW